MRDSLDWQVESLRVTAFPVDISAVSAEKMWETCIGKTPDETRIQRSGIETREAEYANGRIFLIKQVDRVDWRYHMQPEESEEPPALSIIGSIDSELSVVTDLARNWINSGTVSPINRLAFAGVLLYPVESVTAGYEILQRLLPSLNLENVKDLNYQVNRPRMSSAIDGLSINRLSRWNVIRSHIFAAVPSVSLRFRSTADEVVASRLELDINSAAEQTQPIAARSLVSLFDELVGNGLELSKKGDVL